jgi:hypothetical protein
MVDIPDDIKEKSKNNKDDPYDVYDFHPCDPFCFFLRGIKKRAKNRVIT